MFVEISSCQSAIAGNAAMRLSNVVICPCSPNAETRFSNGQSIPPAVNYAYGLSLEGAPQVDDHLFVGRTTEFQQLRAWLVPKPGRQNVVAVSGLGGMGKTQFVHLAERQGRKHT
jgi:hypothetical protein